MTRLPVPAILAALWLGAAPQPAPAQRSAATYSQHMEAGVDALVAQRYIVAANEFRLALAVQPDSSQAALLAGEALVYGREPEEAVPMLLRAEQTEPDSVMLHELLASSYAAMDKPVERDAQLTLLRGWVLDGTHPTLARVPSFLLETLWLGTFHVNATDYLEPAPDDHIYYRFVVRDRADIIEAIYCVSPWHGSADTAAGAGTSVSAYALRACEPTSAQPLHVFATLPDYSLVRNTLIQSIRHGVLVSRK